VKATGGDNYYLQIDDGKTLWPCASQFWYKPIDGQRVLANYTYLYDNFQGYDYGVKVNRLYNVLTKGVDELTADNEEDFGDNPVHITDMWLGGNYLNVEFRMLHPYTHKHRVSLVRNTTVTDIPDDGYIHLEYRYNNQNDVSNHWDYNLVSFNLGDENKEEYKGLKVRINSAVNGERVLTYDFPEDDQPKTIDTKNEYMGEEIK
ncbi:hypothetical protein EZS27_038577, partial [termite gut metagenome]